MQIVIDIPENKYNTIMNYPKEWDEWALNAIKKGTPLPKGHGELIDRSKIYKAIPAEEDNCTGAGMTYDEMDAYNDGIDAMYSRVQGAPTIIEADKEYKIEEITRGKCMMCGKELTEGLFFCKECEAKIEIEDKE